MLICSPARSSYKGIPRPLSITTVKHACWNTKVPQLYYPISIQQDIPSLQWEKSGTETTNIANLRIRDKGTSVLTNLNISMDVPMSMEIFQSLESFLQHRTNSGFFESIWICYLHEMQTRTLGHEGHHHPKVAINNKRTEWLYYIRMVYQTHRLSFPANVILWRSKFFQLTIAKIAAW